MMRAKVPSTEGFVEREGVKLFCEVYGDGPETIFFPPPWAIVHSRVFKAQLPYFSEQYRCVTYDPRGNGKSDRPDDASAYSLDEYVADALSVMDATDIGSAVIVGLSFGGMLACILAAHHPERVKAAVLAGTSANIGPGYPYMTPHHFAAEPAKFEGWEKYNRKYWLADYPDFANHFIANIFSDRHSTKQIEDGIEWANETDGAILAKTVEARAIPASFDVSEAMYRKVRCPMLVIHGDDDQIQPYARGKTVAELTGAEFVTIPGGGHNPLGRYPAKCNALIVDFLDRRFGLSSPFRRAHRPARTTPAKRALYLSSPIGLGHGRRDIAITRELRKHHPDLQVDWLAQDPVTRLLEASGEHVHPLSSRLASETRHIELECGSAWGLPLIGAGVTRYIFSEIKNLPGLRRSRWGSFLDQYSQQPGPCRLSDLSRDVGMPNAKLHRYLVSLIRISLAVQDPDTGLYDLGPMALQLGLLSFSRFDLLRYAEHTLAKLVDAVGESAIIVVWSPRGPSIVKTIEARHDLAVNISHGHACHLTHSASGYVFMAYGDQTALRSLIDEQLKQNKRSGLVGAPTQHAEIEAIVAKTREIGVGVIDYDSHQQGSSAVSAPVLDSTGKLILAVTVFGHHRRLDITGDGPLVTIVRDIVAEFSRNLGLRDGLYVKSSIIQSSMPGVDWAC